MDYYELDINKLLGMPKGPDDILQILSTGLNEKQPWALSFADSVFKDLAVKIKGLKIESKPIKIDGEAISKEINEGIQENISKDIDKTVENIRDGLKDVSKDLSKIDKKDRINVSSLLGQTPQMGLTTRIKYQGLVKNIISKIEKGLPEKIDLGAVDKLQLNSIFAPPGDTIYPLQGLTLALKWTNLRKDILSKIRPPKKNIILDEKNLSLNSIFAPPGDAIYPLQGLTLALKWTNLRKDILNKIKPPKKNITLEGNNINLNSIFAPPGDTIYPLQGLTLALKWIGLRKDILNKIKPPKKNIVLDESNINLNSIFAPPGDAIYPLQGLTLALKWNNLRKDILNKIKIPRKINISGDTLTLDDIMGVAPRAGILTRIRWGQLQRTIIDKIQKGLNQPEKKIVTPSETKKANVRNEKNIQEKRKAIPTKEIEEKKPEKITKSPLIPVTTKTKEFKSLEEKDISVKVSGFTKEAINSLSNLPGLKKVKEITKPESKKEKQDPKKLPTWLATLGLVGIGLLGGGLLASVTSIFNDGPFKGLQKAAGTIMANVGKTLTKTFLPHLKKRISGIFKGIINSISKFVGIFSKNAAKSVSTVGRSALSGILKTGGTFLKGILKKLPVIGTVISLGSAISRIAKGDFIGGMLDVASGIAGLAPVAGTAIAIAIDLFSAARDIKTGGAKKAGQTGINKSIGKFLTEKLEDVPIIGNFIKITKAMGALSTGNWKMAGMYLMGAIPGLGWIFNKESLDKSEKNAPTKSFSQLIRDALKDKIKNILKKFPAFIKNPIYKMLGIAEETENRDSTPQVVKKPSKTVETEFTKIKKEQEEQLLKLRAAAKKAKLPIGNNLSGEFEGGKHKIVTKVSSGGKTADMEALGLLTKEELKIIKETRKMRNDANIGIKSLDKEMNSMRRGVSNIEDFNIKNGKDNQKTIIDSNNNIISKNDKNFEKLINVIKDQKPTASTDRLQTDIGQLIRKMDNAINAMVATNTRNARQNKDIAARSVLGDLAGISDDAGSSRDPAYILRSRAWDRLRKGYVIL